MADHCPCNLSFYVFVLSQYQVAKLLARVQFEKYIPAHIRYLLLKSEFTISR